MRKCLPILLLVAVCGCETYPQHNEDPQEPGTLAVAPFHKRPIVDIEGMPIDEETGAVMGGAAGAVMGGYVAWSLATAVCVGTFFATGGTGCGLAATTAAGAVVGGAVGATAAAKSAEKDGAPYEKRQQQAEPASGAFDIQRVLAVEFLSAASSRTEHQFIADIVTSLADDTHPNDRGQVAPRGAD